jgi:hypothetical protein
MGRGLGPLQQRILVLAYLNRYADGPPDEPLSHNVVLLADVDPDLFTSCFEAAEFILKRLTEPWRFGLTLSTWWEVISVVRQSKLYSDFALSRPGARDWLDLAARYGYQELDDLLEKAGLEKMPDGGWVPSMDLVPGRAVLSWTYRRFGTPEEAWACHSDLMAQGMPAERVVVTTWWDPDSPDLTFAEVLADLFGFRSHLTIRADWAGQRRLPGGSIFDRAAIGEKSYRAASVAVAKALRGLESRDLIHRAAGGTVDAWESSALWITQKGIEEAMRIKGNNPNIIRDVTHYRELG